MAGSAERLIRVRSYGGCLPLSSLAAISAFRAAVSAYLLVTFWYDTVAVHFRLQNLALTLLSRKILVSGYHRYRQVFHRSYQAYPLRAKSIWSCLGVIGAVLHHAFLAYSGWFGLAIHLSLGVVSLQDFQ